MFTKCPAGREWPRKWRTQTARLRVPRTQEIQAVHPQGDQPSVFTPRTDAEAPILWPPDVKKWLIGKDPDAGKDWGQEEKGTTDDEMVGWHHQLEEHGFVLTPGVGDGQGGLACCGSWGCKESDTTERLNWIELTPSNHLILCCSLLLLPSVFPSIRVFSNESLLHIRWPKYWSFSISPSNEYSGLISFRTDWFNLFL